MCVTVASAQAAGPVATRIVRRRIRRAISDDAVEERRSACIVAAIRTTALSRCAARSSPGWRGDAHRHLRIHGIGPTGKACSKTFATQVGKLANRADLDLMKRLDRRPRDSQGLDWQRLERLHLATCAHDREWARGPLLGRTDMHPARCTRVMAVDLRSVGDFAGPTRCAPRCTNGTQSLPTCDALLRESAARDRHRCAHGRGRRNLHSESPPPKHCMDAFEELPLGSMHAAKERVATRQVADETCLCRMDVA